MLLVELHTVTRPDAPSLLSHVLNPLLTRFSTHPPYLQFQFLSLLRKILLSFFVAVAQVGPVLFPKAPSDNGAATTEQLSRMEGLAAASDQEVMRLLALEMTPFSGNPEALNDLRAGMRHWLVDNTIRANPQVRDAMGRVLQPGR